VRRYVPLYIICILLWIVIYNRYIFFRWRKTGGYRGCSPLTHCRWLTRVNYPLIWRLHMDFQGQGLSWSPAFDRDKMMHDVMTFETQTMRVLLVFTVIWLRVLDVSVKWNRTQEAKKDDHNRRSGTSSNSFSKRARIYTINGGRKKRYLSSRYSSFERTRDVFRGFRRPTATIAWLESSATVALARRIEPRQAASPPSAHIRTFALINFCSKHPVSCTCVTDIHRYDADFSYVWRHKGCRFLILFFLII